MVELEYVLFLCVVAPLILMLFLLEGRAKLVMGYMVTGIFGCLFVAEMNTLILSLFQNDTEYMTTVITPITEEIVKMIPILFYAKAFSDRRDTITMISFATGIGFGMFENMLILVQSIGAVTVTWAVVRGFSTALMHGICTYAVGYGISFINQRKKLFYSGVFALLTFAAVYHGIYNMLQLNYPHIGSFLPIVTYIPFVVIWIRRARRERKEKAAR